MISLFLKFSFYDFFPLISNYSNLNNLNNRTIILNNHIHLKDCLFISLIGTNSNGGALSISNINELYCLIEYTTFLTCIVTGNYNGGAIYYEAKGGIAIQFICGYECSTQSSYSHQFGLISILDSSINYCNYLSLLNCPSIPDNRVDIIRFKLGNITLKNYNSTKNYLKAFICFIIHPLNQYLIKYSTFFNNTGTSHAIFGFVHGIINGNFEFSNIISNKMLSSNYGFLYNTINSICNISNCIFLNNLHSNYLILSTTGSIVINNCIIDNFTKSGNFILLNYQEIYTSSFKLNHLNTKLCNPTNVISFNSKFNFFSKFIFFYNLLN